MSDYMVGLTYLAFCMFYEARGEPLTGKVGVGHVVLNRAREKGWTVEQVITEPYQFEWYKEGMVLAVPENGIEEFAECLAAVQVVAMDVLDGKNFKGANHFFNPDVVQPAWAERMVFVRKVGNHAFYRG